MSLSSTYKKGLWSETIAAFFLMFKGYRIMEKRYREKTGEIDVIAKRGKSLIFVEVKARETIRDGLEAVLKNSQERIARTASIYLQKHPKFKDYNARFDVIVMRYGIIPYHYKNCWTL